MQGTLDGFSYGLVTPVVAFIMACLGSALGLRCTTRSVHGTGSYKPGWLALGATSIGSGIWTMHFIAMMGFSVAEAPISYNRSITFASLVVAIVMVGIGIFIVGYRGATVMALLTGGTITGLGVASMHYLGMAGMRMEGTIAYSTPIVILSVVIAVVAATAALWAAVSVHGFMASLGASLVMGVAVTGMHYTGMASVSVHLHGTVGSAGTGDSPASILAPMLLGPLVFLLLAGVVVMFDPQLVMGEPDRNRLGGSGQGRSDDSVGRVNPSLFGQAPDAWRDTGLRTVGRPSPQDVSAVDRPAQTSPTEPSVEWPPRGVEPRAAAPWSAFGTRRVEDDWPLPSQGRHAAVPPAAEPIPPQAAAYLAGVPGTGARDGEQPASVVEPQTPWIAGDGNPPHRY